MKNRMRLLYKSAPPYLYGHLLITDRNGAQRSSSPFIIAETIDETTTIVYGSVEQLLKKLNDLLGSLKASNAAIEEAVGKHEVPTEIKIDSSGRKIRQLPQGDIAGRIFHEYTTNIENALLLMGVYSRILFEMVPKIGKSKIPVYGYDDERRSEVSLGDVADLFCHHRYLFIDGEHIKDLFTDRKYLSAGFMGWKVRWQEYAETLRAVIHRVKIRDLTKILSSGIHRISGEMDHGKIVFVVQNMQSLTKVMGGKISDKRYKGMLDLYFDEKTKELAQAYVDTRTPRGEKGRMNVLEEVMFGNPHFQIRSELSRKEIDVSVPMDIRIGQSFHGPPDLQEHHAYVEYNEFFKKLNDLFGDDPLLPKPA